MNTDTNNVAAQLRAFIDATVLSTQSHAYAAGYLAVVVEVLLTDVRDEIRSDVLSSLVTSTAVHNNVLRTNP